MTNEILSTSAPDEHLSEARIATRNLRSNLDTIRSITGRQQRIMGVVKANAYGHGATMIARALEHEGITDFGVANIEEAIALRQQQAVSPSSGILVFCTPPPSHLPWYIRYDTDLTVADNAGLQAASAAAAASGHNINIHVKTDTGMGRLGLPPEEAMQLCKAVEQDPNLTLKGVYTHFAESTSPGSFTRKQLSMFRGFCSELEHGTGKKILKHAANSGAILSMKESFFDMVRPGIMLYGYPPTDTLSAAPELHPVMQLCARIQFIKTIRKGSTISYDRTWQAPADCRIASIAAGYADGYPRILSNRTSVRINGHDCPQRGTITMDQFMVELPPEATAAPGDWAILFGWEGPQLQELAHTCGTITYELLCAVAGRVHRTPVT